MESFSESENFSKFCKVVILVRILQVGEKVIILHTTITFTFVEPEPGRAERIADFPLSGLLLLLECSPALLGIFENLVYTALVCETSHDSFPCCAVSPQLRFLPSPFGQQVASASLFCFCCLFIPSAPTSGKYV